MNNPIDWFNVKDYGALGDGINDDYASIQNAIDAANNTFKPGTTDNQYSVVYFPPGNYRTSQEILVTNNSFYGCRIEGANAQSVTIKPLGLAAGGKVFTFRGGSGAFTNTGMKNMTILAETNGECTGIYIDGQCFALFENIRLMNLDYGVWLHNNSSGAFSELNQFDHLQLDYCNNGIRIEQGSGNDSFHGNDFNNCYINVGAGQTGFNHVSGYLYNARFRLFMWSHSTSAVYVNATGNAENNIGDITFESFQQGQLTGNGRFWFNGFLRGIGGITDNTVHATSKVFACDNYWKAINYSNTGMQAGALPSQNTAYNGPAGFFQSMVKQDVQSVVLNTYAGSDENGLYLGRSAFQQNESTATMGFFLAGSGSLIKSYHQDGALITGLREINFNMGIKVLSGKINFSAGPNSYRWVDAIPFNNFIAGRLILTTGDQSNQWAPSSVYDCHWGINAPVMTVFNQSPGWNNSWNEFLVAQFDTASSRKIQVGANVMNAIEMWWYFIGVVH